MRKEEKGIPRPGWAEYTYDEQRAGKVAAGILNIRNQTVSKINDVNDQRPKIF